MEIKGKVHLFFEQSATFRDEFRKLGYNEMVRQLKPKTILLFGNKIDLKGTIIYIKCGGFHGKSE